MKRFAFALLAIIVLKSCSNSNSLETAQQEARFVFENTMDETDTPKAKIYIEFNGKNTLVESVYGNASQIEPAQFEDFDIPVEALSACQSYWAGAGDFFYFVKSEKGLTVFSGWQDGEQEGTGFHWSKFIELE